MFTKKVFLMFTISPYCHTVFAFVLINTCMSSTDCKHKQPSGMLSTNAISRKLRKCTKLSPILLLLLLDGLRV